MAPLLLLAGLGAGAALADEAADLHARIQGWQAQRQEQTAPAVSVDEVRRALSGERVTGLRQVEGVAAGKGYGLAVYDLPVEQVWKALTDEDHHAPYFPVIESRTVRGTPRAPGHEVWQLLDLPVVSDRWWITHVRYNGELWRSSGKAAWELSFKDVNDDPAARAAVGDADLARGEPLAWTRGAWLLVSLGPSRTFASYYVWTDPGGSVPAGIASRLSAGTLVETLDAVETVARDHVPGCGGAWYAPDGSAL